MGEGSPRLFIHFFVLPLFNNTKKGYEGTRFSMESSRRKTFGERDKYTNTADSIKEKLFFARDTRK